MDAQFRVELISQIPNPQTVIWYAAHQDYAEGFAFDDEPPTSETLAGESIVKNLLKGGRGHYGPLEHPQIVLNIGWFPHSTMQQIRTHRVGVSFDVQSFRYTGSRIYELGKYLERETKRFCCGISGVSDLFKEILRYGTEDAKNTVTLVTNKVGDVFYLRPIGEYSDRQGKKYFYSEELRRLDLIWCAKAAIEYSIRIDQGFSEEHARGLIPFDVRQHWVMSANVRSLMHLLDLRWKANAQLEAQQLCQLIWPHFKAWVPEVAAWYEENRAKKARLAP